MGFPRALRRRRAVHVHDVLATRPRLAILRDRTRHGRGARLAARQDDADREDALNTTSSPAAVLFIVAIVALRTGARAVIGDGHTLNLDAFAITDMLIALALGLFTTQRIEMYLRAKRMLETARVR
jgi:hypothetical protein